jgi:sugar lactone lactonase YvrE
MRGFGSYRRLTIAPVMALLVLGLSTVNTGSVSAGSQPYPNGTLFIADQSNALYELLPDSQEVSYLAGVDEAVEDVTVDSSGDLFWTQAENGDIDELVPGQGIKTLVVAEQPYGIAVDSSGDVFYGAEQGLFEIPSGQTSPIQISTQGVFTSLAVDGNGDIWAVARGVLYLIPAGSNTAYIIDVPGDLQLTSIQLDADNDLWASTGPGEGAVELSVGTLAATPLGSVGGSTNGVAVDTSGDLYFGQPASNNESYGTIWKVPAGGSLTDINNGEIQSVGGLSAYPKPISAARGGSTIDLTTSSPSSVAAGQQVDLSAAVSSPGLVQFEQDGSPLGSPVETVDGVANLQTTLYDGVDQVSAAYLGDGGSAPSSSNTLDFVVGTLDSTTAISAPDGTSVPGNTDATLDVTVSGAGPVPTGTVTIYSGTTVLDQNVPLASGHATASFPLHPGTSKVDAVYSGDSTYHSSTSSKITFSTKAPYEPSITATPKYVTKKTSTKVTIPVTVKGNDLAGAPTGSISASDGFVCGSTSSTGTALTAKCTETFDSSTLDTTVTISYSGGGSYVAATDTVAVQYGT